MQPFHSKRGSVLLLSLMILSLMGFIAASLAFRASIGLRLVSGDWNEIRLEQIAKIAVFAVNQSRTSGDGRIPLVQNQPVADGSFSVEAVEDESGKMNLNTAAPDALRRLFAGAPAIVPALAAWRLAAGRPLQSIEEVEMVQGMTPELFAFLRENATVYTSGPVNINTASESVLEILGIPASLAHKILLFRQGPDGVEGTSDDGFFPAPGMVLSLLKQNGPLTDMEAQAYTGLLDRQLLTAQSDSVRLHITAYLSDSHAVRHYDMVMSSRIKPGRILFWQEKLQ